MAKPSFDFPALIQKSWQIFQKNAVVLVLAMIIMWVIMAIAGGIAAAITGRLAGIAIAAVQGPLALGLFGIVLSAARGGSPLIPALFEGFNRLVPAFLASLCISAPSILASLAGGSLLSMIMFPISLVFLFLFGLTYLYMSDKKLDFWPAMQSSMQTVMKDVGLWLVTYVVVVVLSCAGVIACFVGLLVTVPMGTIVLALAYDQVTGGGYSVSEAPAHEDYQA
ncbi:MAG: hypothetical protein IT367_08940 [Candidatus Hydrogenedentes bacterium]|nr:hypothetical protein [Candidatus Hydrogenedentota bacterium]